MSEHGGRVAGMRFQWQPMATAPRDRTSFVYLRTITHVGGSSRPIDIVPELGIFHRTGVDPKCGGYWLHSQHEFSVGDYEMRLGYWMQADSYRAAIAGLPPWRSAPRDRGPLVFVRPVDPAVRYCFSHDVYAADIVWPIGADAWKTANTLEAGRGCHPGYLDGQNVNCAPFAWCALEEFVPAETLTADTARRVRISGVSTAKGDI